MASANLADSSEPMTVDRLMPHDSLDELEEPTKTCTMAEVVDRSAAMLPSTIPTAPYSSSHQNRSRTHLHPLPPPRATRLVAASNRLQMTRWPPRNPDRSMG